MSGRPSIAVIGGGIAGLAAARELAEFAKVTVIEASSVLGGKIVSDKFRGRPHDRGPDAFITRNASAVELCRSIGLGDDLIAPSKHRDNRDHLFAGISYVCDRHQV